MKTIPTFRCGLTAALLSLCALPALAQSSNADQSGTGWAYTASTSTLAISSDNAWADSQSWQALQGAVTTITINGAAYIPDEAFKSFGLLSSVTMDNTVKYIGEYAFYECGYEIEEEDTFFSVSLSTAIDSICSYAFERAKLKELDLSNCASLTKIGVYAFHECTSLTTVQLPASVEIIDSHAFNSCKQITTLDLSVCSKLTTIGYMAFYDCRNISSLTIPASVTSIGSLAFASWKQLTSVTLLSSSDYTAANPHIIYLGSQVDNNRNATPLRDLENPKPNEHGEDVVYQVEKRDDDDNYYAVLPIDATLYYNPSNTYIGDFGTKDNLRYYFNTFPTIYYEESSKTLAIFSTDALNSDDYKSYDSKAENLVFADDCQLTSIPASAFANFTALKNVSLPATLTSISEEAFLGCAALESLTIPDGVTTIGNKAFSGCSSLASVTLPATLTSISEEAFLGCAALESLTIPDGVTTIGNKAFSGCSSLASVTLPATLTSISEEAFLGCAALEELVIPNGVTTIGYKAFSGCSSLAVVYLYDNVENIGSYAFDGCNNIAVVAIVPSSPDDSQIRTICLGSDDNNNFNTDPNATGTNVFPTTAYLYYNPLKTNIGDKGTKNNLRSYFSNFIGYYGEKLLVIYDKFAFDKNNPLCPVSAFELPVYEVTFTDDCGITSIPDGAFKNYTYLKSVVGFPAGITSIGEKAFYGCKKLTTLDLSNCTTLESIGDDAFHSCKKLEVDLSNCTKLKTIGGGAFYECKALQKIDLSNCSNFESIGEGAFSESGITDFTFPPSLKSIGDFPFNNCPFISDLTTLTLPSNLERIGDLVFKYCTNLQTVTILSDNKVYNEDNKHIIKLGDSTDESGYGNEVFPEECAATLVYDPKTTYVGENGTNLSHYFTNLSPTSLLSPILNQSTTLYYDLQGRPMTQPSSNSPAIVIRNGQPALILTK